jgi:hypothetical protein
LPPLPQSTSADTRCRVTDGGASGVNMIIGQKFLENFYSVFDSANHRVGFAKRA